MPDLQLRDYQLVARDYLRERGRAGLFLDMGLGKTATCLAALEPRHLPALVVAPKAVAEEVWGVEAELWRPDLSIALAVGDPAARTAARRRKADITVISRDNLRDVLDGAVSYRTLIIDELSGYKTPSGVRFKTARKLEPTMEYVWGLTGTPSPNGYHDLWSQVYLLDQGKRLGRTITTYRSRFFYPGYVMPSGVVTEWILKDGADAKIQELISDICLSMETDGRVNLPPVSWPETVVQLPDKVMQAYRKMSNDLVLDAEAIFGEGEIFTAASAGVLSSKLSQMTAGFLYVDDADLRNYEHVILHDKKIKALQSIVEGNEGWPVLVFYRFNAELEMIKKALPQARHVSEPGIIKEWNRGEVPVMLAHPASVGHGLNLQHGGHTAVWTSLPWDLELWEQANKRLARSGQKHPVVIHILLADGTIDRRVLDSLHAKTQVQKGLLEYLESPV